MTGSHRSEHRVQQSLQNSGREFDSLLACQAGSCIHSQATMPPEQGRILSKSMRFESSALQALGYYYECRAKELSDSS